jgi:RNA polymerase sigma-B factor
MTSGNDARLGPRSADGDRTSPPAAHMSARRSARAPRRPDADQRLLRVHARSPSPETREALVRRYLPLARDVASRHAFGTEPWDDLFQVACLALVYAIDRYDPDRRASFSSFAYPTMRGEVLRHLRDRSFMVRPTRSMLDLAPRVRASQRSLAAENGRPPTVADVADALDVEPEAVRQALHVRRLRSVESLSPPDGEISVLASKGVEETGYEGAETRAALQPLLKTLSARDRRIVTLRFVEDRTQKEIADAIGISQMHVSRLLAGALERMRAAALPPAA